MIMCQRRENEPVWSYALRWVAEQPKTILAMVGLVAAGVIYVDFKNYLYEQSLLQKDTVRVLTELTARIEHIERRLEQ